MDYRRRTLAKLYAVVTLVCATSGVAHGQLLQQQFQPPEVLQNEGAAIVTSSTNVLNEVMAIPAKGIPRALLRDAQGIAVVPGLLRGGFVVGVRHGRGIVVVKDEAGNWRAPSFISVTGGSIGWQAGVQSIDLVLVFKTQRSLEGLLRGKFTVGADASAAAGPVGREVSAATDATLRAEIFSYSRSRGLFAGAAIDGSMISLDNEMTYAYYRGTGILPGDGPAVQPPRMPPSADQFLQAVLAYSQPEGVPVAVAQAPTPTSAIAPNSAIVSDPAPNTAEAELTMLKPQIADASHRMSLLLDENWQRFLALPMGLSGGAQPPTIEEVNAAVDRFDKVAANPSYAALAQRPEFQQTLKLLKSYQQLQAAAVVAPATIVLPPPPQ